MDEELRTLDSYYQYTVGWLAPLPIERAAAEALLDERHKRPHDLQQPTTDPLSYSFGSIGEHNIVIASLESGSYGNVSAATTATSMLSTFPEIRFGLLVGIGGGIPRPEIYDLRLGDIVVGDPSGNSGGVVQYDLVKAKAGGQKERKDFLNRPPLVLLQALAALKAQHERIGSRVPEILQEMKERNPIMFRKRANNPGYGYQDEKNDRLFKPPYEHVQGMDCQRCSKEEEVEREPRDDGNDPVIHYGVIASGNTLVKDSVARQELLKHISDDCICYEMEAAGLMNNFPCLVIRGICDYSDSHKNHRWQRYSAATAASFAKELLGFVRPSMVQETPKASEIIYSKVSNDVKEICNISTDSKAILSELQLKEWLHPPDPSGNYQNARIKRQKNTCHWFLESNEFEEWREKPKSFLWIHGIAGCGKTVLSSAIIQTLRDTRSEQTHVVLYFYFDFDDQGKQTCDHMLRTFLTQMCRFSEKARNQLSSFYKSVKGEQPSTDNLYDWFTSLTTCFEDIKIVIDAVDEVKDVESRRQLLSTITQLLRVEEGKVSFIAMSRNEPDISTAFQDVGSTTEINSRSVSSDIRKYVLTMISGEGFKRWHRNHKVLGELESYLTLKSNGMFRWVFCQVEVLRECLDEASLRRALTKLPATLDETYNRALGRIPESQQQSALRLLQFLAFSERSINVGEALDVMAVDLSRQPEFHPEYRMPVPEDILRFCPTMLTIERYSDRYSSWYDEKIEPPPMTNIDRYPSWHKLHKSDRLRLAHLTVKEYLLSPTKMDKEFRQAFQEPQARANMFEISLGYIVSIASLSVEHLNLPFTDMAILDLMAHARKSDKKQIVADKLLNFLQPQKAFSFWLYHYCEKAGLGLAATDEPHNFESLPSPLFVAAYFGLENLIHRLKDKESITPAHVGAEEVIPFWLYRNNDSELCRSTPLYAAAMQGQIGVFKILSKDFTCLNDRCGPMGTALDVACCQGQKGTVELILHQATTNHYELNFQKAFLNASDGCHFGIMQLMLDYGVPTRPVDPPCSLQNALEPLYWRESVLGAAFAYFSIISNQPTPVLCSMEPDWMYLPLRAICHREDPEDTPSHPTTLEVDETRLNILLPFVSPRDLLEMRDKFGRSLLHLAIQGGYGENERNFVRALLEVAQRWGFRKELLQMQGRDGQTALHIAVLMDRSPFLPAFEVVTPFDVRGNVSLIHYAAEMLPFDFLKAFLDEGDNILIEKRKEFLQDFLRLVDKHSYNRPTLVNLLIHKGADKDAKDHQGMTPLHHAARKDNFEVMVALIQAGANPGVVDNEGHSPLFHAIFREKSRSPLRIVFAGILQLSIATPDLPHLSAFWLHHAVVHGDHSRARQIIESEEMWFLIVNSRDIQYGRTPLHRAAARGWRKVVNLLIDFGAELDPGDNYGRTPIYYAAVAGHSDIVNILDGSAIFHVSDRER